jgi:hypothetical protein
LGGEGKAVSVDGMVALAGRVGAAVGLGAQFERTRLARMRMEEKIYDFFMEILPLIEEDIDIL